MVRLAFAAAALAAAALAASCKTENPAFCEAHPGIDGCAGDATNGGACSIDGDCTLAGFGVCDTTMPGGSCVECTANELAACGGKACIADKCQPCASNDQCSSRACLADGTCAAASAVAYVRPGGSGTACTDAAPCGSINAGLAASAIVKVEGGAITDTMATTIDGKAIQILADKNCSLTRSTQGVILAVMNDGAKVQVYDLEIANGSGMKTDPAISLSGPGTLALSLTRVKVDNNAGIGVVASSGSLTIAQSTFTANTGGGILVSGNAVFDITNSFIVTNGAPANDPNGGMPVFGGVLISSTSSAARRFEFNTVANNSSNSVTGLQCAGAVPLVTFTNSIVAGNQSGGGHMQFGGGTCSWTYSDIGDAVAPIGTGNTNVDPMFVNGNTDFHLKPASPMKDAADPAATIMVDFDGDHRPVGPHSDIGADEIAQ